MTSCLRSRFHFFALTVGALLASLTSHPGFVPADTKLYLYLDPLRLISDSIWSWDGRMFGGWVPHQNVGYLWPTGPFFAFFDFLHTPDWVAHRLWISVLMVIAGSGAYRLARSLGCTGAASLLVGAAYQFSPYVLPYISRTSALLLPWSLLPWLILIAVRYSQCRRSRDLAIFGLLVFSSGGLNATALLMVAPAPLIWLVYAHSPFRRQAKAVRHFFGVTLALGAVSLLVSAWWLVGLAVQGRYGAAVLSYSEALQSTSATSSAPEVLRGLGYWLFYDRGPVAPLTSASIPYQTSIPLIIVGASLVVLGLAGMARSGRWRMPLATMLTVGFVLSIGAHPFDDSNLAFGVLAENPKNALSLALRSSTRAVPLVALSLAIGIGFLWQSRRSSTSVVRIRIAYATLLVLIVGNLPAAVTGDLADPVLLRPEQIPETWTQAAEFLDSRYEEGHTGSVLLLPGIESAAYRWGYPVDPILPGISIKPLVTRDWLPLGSPAVMDLLYAFDDSLQDGSADPRTIAPVARMLGADTVMFVSSHQYERFDTIGPSRAFDIFDPVPEGLTFLAEFGEPFENDSSRNIWSEEQIQYPLMDLPEILLFSVEDADSPTKLHRQPYLTSTDGTGLVDLATMQVLDGSELLLSEASLDDTEIHQSAGDAPEVIITDSNRRRAHHWRGSQEVWGATEPEAGVLSVRDDFDSRLPIHPEQSIASETIVEASRVEATATAYGAALRYHPEFRPRMSVDGDTSTAWRLGPDRTAVGHVLTLTAREPLSTLRLLQPQDRNAVQWITKVSIRTDGATWQQYELTDTSRRSPGQTIALSTPSRWIEIRIDQLNDETLRLSSLGIGFAEVLESSASSPEIVVLPRRLVDSLDSVREDRRITLSINRLRSDPFDRWRGDPESSLVRRLPVDVGPLDEVEFEVRLSARATDDILAAQLGWTGAVATSRMHGSATWWGPAAFDGAESTHWWGPVSTDTRASGPGTFLVPVDEPVQWMEIQQNEELGTSTIRRIEVGLISGDQTHQTQIFDVPSPDPNGVSRVDLSSRFDTRWDGTSTYDRISIAVVDIDAHEITDAYTGRRIAAPVSISEIRSNAWSNTPIPEIFDSGCKDDLLSVDSRPVPLRISGSTAAALAGEPVGVTLCEPGLPKSPPGGLLAASPGIDSGWDIDRMRISNAVPSTHRDTPTFLASVSSRASFTAKIPVCQSDCWLESPFGFSSGWTATLDSRNIGAPMRTATGRSLWRIPAGDAQDFSATWAPQRWMWWGLGISAVTVLALLFAITFDRKRYPITPQGSPVTTLSIRTPGSWSRSRWIAAVAGFLLGTMLVSLFWGLLIAGALLVMSPRRLVESSVVAVAIGYAFVVAQQIRLDPSPGFGWPSVFERAHQPLLAVILTFAVAVHVFPLHPNDPDPDPEPPMTPVEP